MHYIIILIFFQISLLFPEDITSIKIQGNKITKEYIILREINQQANQELVDQNIIDDKNRIYNLGLFSSVDIEVVDNAYIVTVSESWYLWPFPIIKYDNKSEKFSYGAGIAHNNFRGRDEDIVFGATFGYVKEYFLWYQNPWISGDHNSLVTGVYDVSSNHHVYSVLEKNNGFFIESGFYKGYNHQFKYSTSYNNKVIENVVTDNTNPLDADYLGKFSYIGLTFNYIYDTRDIYIDPHSGILFNIECGSSFGLNGFENIYGLETYFNIYKNLYKSYLDPTFRYQLSTRLQYSDIDKNKFPIFRKEYIGGQDYIRGYSPVLSDNPMSNSKELIEVDNYVINNFELQSTIIKRQEYIDKVELGIDIVFFADYGIGYNLNESINFNNALFGYGIGLRIFVMGGVIKLDYGFNYHGSEKFHFFN